MSAPLETVEYPELIIGIAGPIGVDIDAVSKGIQDALLAVSYNSNLIKLTRLFDDYPIGTKPVRAGDDYASEMNYKMDYANALCDHYKDKAVLARMAIREIMDVRASVTGSPTTFGSKLAFIVRQLKRPDEVKLLRQVYGRQFLLISAYGTAAARAALLEEKLKRTLPTATPGSQIKARVAQLIERDEAEDVPFAGQELRETFHMADVFVDGMNKESLERKITRFVSAFFGKTDIAPTKDEYGMYTAKSASLRSSDLSRQVGAAIFSVEGDLITQGCNDVPRAGGGLYWDGEEPDFRDVKVGVDPNEQQRNEIVRDLFERLLAKKLLADRVSGMQPSRLAELLTKKQTSGEDADIAGSLAVAAVMDLTEYGRVVHAEMCAVCDAARLGKSLKGAVLFCTTFPCHNCTKHLIAAGITRVVYMEPYPKSKAQELHPNEIILEGSDSSRVSFVPFLGIAPHRYRDIFEKGKRKDRTGRARDWYAADNRPKPLLNIAAPAYMDLEPFAIAPLVGDLTPDSSSAVAEKDEP